MPQRNRPDRNHREWLSSRHPPADDGRYWQIAEQVARQLAQTQASHQQYMNGIAQSVGAASAAAAWSAASAAATMGAAMPNMANDPRWHLPEFSSPAGKGMLGFRIGEFGVGKGRQQLGDQSPHDLSAEESELDERVAYSVDDDGRSFSPGRLAGNSARVAEASLAPQRPQSRSRTPLARRRHTAAATESAAAAAYAAAAAAKSRERSRGGRAPALPPPRPPHTPAGAPLQPTASNSDGAFGNELRGTASKTHTQLSEEVRSASSRAPRNETDVVRDDSNVARGEGHRRHERHHRKHRKERTPQPQRVERERSLSTNVACHLRLESVQRCSRRRSEE
jgi:hypothetical protein